MGGAGGDYLEGGEETSDCGQSGGAGGLSNLSLILGGVHLTFCR